MVLLSRTEPLNARGVIEEATVFLGIEIEVPCVDFRVFIVNIFSELVPINPSNVKFALTRRGSPVRIRPGPPILRAGTWDILILAERMR